MTGRAWRYHPTLNRLECSGERYQASAVDDGSPACIHRCEKGTFWDDEVERMRHAITLARLQAITAASTIRQLLDVRDSEAVPGEFGYPGTLIEIWEWADISLDDFLDEPDENPAEVADSVHENIGAALDVLHEAGIVHLDVTPNNILRVGGRWKLADLDSCVPRGELAVRRPISDRYVHPDRHGGTALPARDEFDSYGVERILTDLRFR